MPEIERDVESHYAIGDLYTIIIESLKATGKDLNKLKPGDLSPVDAFHTRGKEATLEIAQLAELSKGMNVLDVGCGIGGSVRYLSDEHGCKVTGLDLTEEYISVAKRLAELTSMSDKVTFIQGSALELPFEDNQFDLVWTEHTQMNIENKDRFYSEIYRVLKPGGRMVFSDIFQGNYKDLYYPVPWASEASCSFLATPDDAKSILEALGFEVKTWIDKSAQTLKWFKEVSDQIKVSGPPPISINILMGKTAPQKLGNMIRNLEDGKTAIFQCSAVKA